MVLVTPQTPGARQAGDVADRVKMPEDRGPGGDRGTGDRQSPESQSLTVTCMGLVITPTSEMLSGREPWASVLIWSPSPQSGPIVSRDTGRCLEVEMSKDANFGLRLVVQRCSGQKWTIRNWIKRGRQ